MKLYQILLALAVAVPLSAEPRKIDKDDFLHHVQSWQLPEYPRKSADERHTGVVTATVDVDAEGRVSSVNIVSSPDVHMADTVKSVISQWRFRSFNESGKSAPVESTIYVEFRLHPMGPNVMIPGLTEQPEPIAMDPFTRPQQ